MKVYKEILVPTDILDEAKEFLEEQGYVIEKISPANSEWISNLAGPGIGFVSSMHSEPLYFDVVYSIEISKKKALEIMQQRILLGTF